jgi:hypothetical protein
MCRWWERDMISLARDEFELFHGGQRWIVDVQMVKDKCDCGTNPYPCNNLEKKHNEA